MKKRFYLILIMAIIVCGIVILIEQNVIHQDSSVAWADSEEASTMAGNVGNDFVNSGYMENYDVGAMSYSMNDLKQMYPAGSKWNGEWESGVDCCGFSLRLSFLYNNCVSTFTYGISHDINDIKPGSMARYKCGAYDHSIFITGISGETVYYSDANYDLCGTIRWDMSISKSELASLMKQKLNRPYDVRSHQYSTTGFILCYDKRIITYDISECDISVSDVDRYKGQSEPTVVVTHNGKTLTKGTDYTYYYASKYDDEGTIAIQGKGNYEGEVLRDYKVIRVNLSGCTVSYTKSYQYTGDIINPENIVVTNPYGKVIDESLYYIDYSFYPVEPGTYKAYVCGSDNQDIYEGELAIEYKIVPREIMTCEVIYHKGVEFVGTEVYPSVTVIYRGTKLIQDVDYVVSYENNDSVGIGKIIITAKSSRFTGQRTVEFEIYVKEHEITIH